MRCPYHPERPAAFTVPEALDVGDGWLGWLEGCCGLPIWRCPEGSFLPIEAAFCTYHGCARPPLNRVLHEVAAARGAPARLPPLGERPLELAPMADGRSTPCLVGNVLVYLTENGRLVAIDMGSDAALFLADQVKAVAAKHDAGQVVCALRAEAGVRYLTWPVAELRDALARGGTAVRHELTAGTGSHLLGLPRDRSRLHVGSGNLRLVVEHDPVPVPLAELYVQATGARPGAWLVHRVVNPDGPPVYYPNLRPQLLHQVPVPIPGGVLVLGQVRSLGRTASGALLVPTVGRQDAAAA